MYISINELSEERVTAEILSRKLTKALSELEKAIERDKILGIERDFLSDHKNWNSCSKLR